MSGILHVLNGDETLRAFDETGLDGDVLVWREVLSEGPLQENVSSANFWSARAKWVSNTFDDPAEDYQNKVVGELGKLNGHFEEINLWFEYDLHCQVNLMGVLQMLNQKTDLSAPAVYLICPADHPDVDDFRGMGQLDADQLENLYDNRERLNDWEFQLAAEAWPLYVNNDAAKLAEWINENSFWGALSLLKPALQAHIKRLQINAGGLNYIEKRLLDIYQAGTTDRLEIYKAFWFTEKIYGMGDSEIDIYLKKLQELRLIDLQ